MDPMIQKYLANKYQLDLNDDEKQALDSSDQRANSAALGQGLMEAADTMAAGIANREKTRPLLAGNPYQSSNSVREYIMGKLRDRRGAALEEADTIEKQNVAKSAAQAKAEEARLSADRERNRDIKADKNRRQDMTLKLQDQWNSDPNVKRAVGAHATARTIRGLAEKGTGQSDIGLIMAFNRAIDQGARTTKDDYEAIEAAKGYMDNVEAWTKKAETGEILTPKQRQSMVEVAQRFSDEASRDADEYYENVFKPTSANAGVGHDITAYRPWAQKEQKEKQTQKAVNVVRASALPPVRK